MAATYPPDQHLLRDLRISFEHSTDTTSGARMPVVPALAAPDGSVRAGALATLVDVIGGGLAATVAHPSWIATADLTLHLYGAAVEGDVEADARVVHAGRTTVVIEVDLRAVPGASIGLATMSFAALPRRAGNPDVTTSTAPGPSTMALEGSSLRRPLLDELEVRVVDPARGELEAPVGEWSRNSLGAMQGGAVATLIDAAATTAVNVRASEPLVVTDLQITYLALSRSGPLRTRVDLLAADTEHAEARVEVVDGGASTRRTALARIVASRSLRTGR